MDAGCGRRIEIDELGESSAISACSTAMRWSMALHLLPERPGRATKEL